MTPANSRILEVDGERFLVSRRSGDEPTVDYTWLTGPNHRYGFSETGNTVVHRTDEDHRRVITEFLQDIDPATGYLAE